MVGDGGIAFEKHLHFPGISNLLLLNISFVCIVELFVKIKFFEGLEALSIVKAIIPG